MEGREGREEKNERYIETYRRGGDMERERKTKKSGV